VPSRRVCVAIVPACCCLFGPVLEARSAEPAKPPDRLRPPPSAARTDRAHDRPARPSPVNDTRAASVVTRRDFEERLPRSAPDALRYEPGVYVQQTAHGQGSPYVRGLTGQQTIMLFDGIRLNNSTFRQGPNQYFFTIDSRTIQKLEVLRGSASTRHGSDAMGGALLATPIDPSMQLGPRKWQVHPRAMTRVGQADGEFGGRAQLDLAYKDKVGLFGGVGYRDVGLLRTGGRIYSPDTGMPVKVPLQDSDGVARGTGFNEFTADARLVVQAHDKVRLTFAYYDYRQSDAPRTDRCPPDTAPQSECLTYDEQYRTLVYTALDLQRGPGFAERLRFTVNYGNQHERRRFDRGAESTYKIIGRDDVHTGGTGLSASTREWGPAGKLRFSISYGFDLYHDKHPQPGLEHLHRRRHHHRHSRGQYIDGSTYLTSGLWTEGKLKILDRLELRAGGRGAYVMARSPATRPASPRRSTASGAPRSAAAAPRSPSRAASAGSSTSTRASAPRTSTT
jgi:outer membrane receptor protein involved in Fe transport